MKFIPQNFNDLLALVLMVLVIPLLWILDGLSVMELDNIVTGALIPIWTLIAQYYFRKKESET